MRRSSAMSEQRKEWLADRSIDQQIVGGWLDMFGYELPAEEGADWCRFMNEQLLSERARSSTP